MLKFKELTKQIQFMNLIDIFKIKVDRTNCKLFEIVIPFDNCF